MVKIYGASDDLVEIEGSKYKEDEIGCYEADVRIWFDDGMVILVSYGKEEGPIWKIDIECPGAKMYFLTVCHDEDADIYSDILETESDIMRHEVISHA